MSTTEVAVAPRVSVVVPIYNVERYLTECLESLAHQSMADLEVVMVDDGATDTSADIAAAFAAEDPRFVLVRQQNGGLGNARNTGADRARGRYLAFVDSDDVVTERAYELLADSLDATGSDFATGNFHRLTTGGTRQAGMVFTAFNANRPRTHVSRHPALLNDRTAWNKLFRRTFWDEHGFRWPEGVLYEDIPVTLLAHVLATAVDVVREPVYLWRARSEDTSSITQRRVEPKAIDDRFAAVDGVSRFMAARGETTLKKLYDESVAAQDLRYFLQHLDEGDTVFHERFLSLANDFFDRAAPDVFDSLPAVQRLQWHLVRRRLLPELLEAVRFESSGAVITAGFTKRGRRLYGDYPFRDDPTLRVPLETYRLDKQELPMPALVEDVWWEGETLHLAGYAAIAGLTVISSKAARLRVSLEESGHADRVVSMTASVIRRTGDQSGSAPAGSDAVAAAPVGTARQDWSGWTASVPASALRHGGRFRTGSWRLRVELRVDGITRRRWVGETAPGRATRPGSIPVDFARVTPTTPAGRFAVQVNAQYALVERVDLDGGVLELGGTLIGREFDQVGASLRVARDDGTASVEAPVATHVTPRGSATAAVAAASPFESSTGTPFLTRIDLVALMESVRPDPGRRSVEDAGDGAVWELTLRPDTSSPRLPLVAADDLPEPALTRDGTEVVVRVDRTGRVRIVDRTPRPQVDHVAAENGVLVLAGRHDLADKDQRLVAVLTEQADARRTVMVPVTCENGQFAVRLSPADVPRPLVLLPPDEGRWDLHLRVSNEGSGGDGVGDDDISLLRVEVARGALPLLPVTCTAGDDALTALDELERRLVLHIPFNSAALSDSAAPPDIPQTALENP